MSKHVCLRFGATQKQPFWSQQLMQKAVGSVDIHTPASMALTPIICSEKARPTSNYELLVRPPRRIRAAKWPGLCSLAGGHEPRTARSARATIKHMSLSVKKTWEDCYTGLCWGLYACACWWEWVGQVGMGSSGDEFRTLHMLGKSPTPQLQSAIQSCDSY